jgi:unsaturated rhamnogalacturonyl hydrolase
MMKAIIFLFISMFVISCNQSQTQTRQPVTDANTPLHLLQPDYDTPYKIPKPAEITTSLVRVLDYLEETTPAGLIDKEGGEAVKVTDEINLNTIIKPGDFRLTSYEWGVTYAGMLLAGDATGDEKFTQYTTRRLSFLSEIRPLFLNAEKENPDKRHALTQMLHPDALDDAGAMCAAFIKAREAGLIDDTSEPIIENYISYISNKQYRLSDGTLARNRPLHNSLWLDDLFMSVPALAQMGHYTGEKKYFDDAVKQVLQFSERMFNHEKGLFMHAWIEGMKQHPQFHWGRANGWAIMTMVELLEVLPKDHEGYLPIVELLQKHIEGLARCQSPEGFWHQLLDRNDSYLETSATAIYLYAIARAINRGYVDAQAYGPMLCLAWNAVDSKINDIGQVEGTCVGTGMGFDPAFYYYRPVSAYAAHGYGPVLLAGAEMIELVRNFHPKMNDSAIMFYREKIETDAPIFSVN